MHNKKGRVSEMKLDFFCLFSAEYSWGDAAAALEEFAEGRLVGEVEFLGDLLYYWVYCL
jgi:hypothetical protein